MTKFYDALKTLINSEMISRASTTVEENSSNVSTAVSSVLSSLLGVMLKKGDTPQMSNLLEEAGKLNILLDSDEIWEEKPTVNQQKIGDDFLQHLLGDKAADFTNPIAEHANISKVATNRIVSMVAPVFAGYLGNKMVKENHSLTQILNEIGSEKALFAKNIPADILKSFGLSSVLEEYIPAETKKNYKWVIWVAIIIVLLLLFLWWRSCRNTHTTENHNNRTMVADTISRSNNQSQTSTSTATPISHRDTSYVVLPNGIKLTTYDDGIEERMVEFLNSDKFKNATDKDLNDKWFEFDNISFEFGSSTELKKESQMQLDNIVAILKAYKNAKVKIAGFADKKGTEAANMSVSKKRAKTVESLLEKAGVGSQIVKTEGYGDEYAKHSASDSNEERAEDRDIALRFVK